MAIVTGKCRLIVALLLTILLLWISSSEAGAPALSITAGGVTMEFTPDELLARPDAATIAVPSDPAYRQAMTYRGVPLRALLSALPSDAADTIQARATDGFVAEIPRAVIGSAAVPWIAVEDVKARLTTRAKSSSDSLAPEALVVGVFAEDDEETPPAIRSRVVL